MSGALFPADARIIRLDNEPDGGQNAGAEYVRADIQPFIEGLLERVQAAASPTWRDTVPEVAGTDFRSSSPVEDPVDFGPDGRLNPRAVVAALDRILPAERSVVMDGGHFIGWAPMYLSVPDPHAMVLVGTAFQSIGHGFGSAAVGRALGAEGAKARTLSDWGNSRSGSPGTTTACSFWMWPSRRRSLPST